MDEVLKELKELRREINELRASNQFNIDPNVSVTIPRASLSLISNTLLVKLTNLNNENFLRKICKTQDGVFLEDLTSNRVYKLIIAKVNSNEDSVLLWGNISNVTAVTSGAFKLTFIRRFTNLDELNFGSVNIPGFPFTINSTLPQASLIINSWQFVNITYRGFFNSIKATIIFNTSGPTHGWRLPLDRMFGVLGQGINFTFPNSLVLYGTGFLINTSPALPIYLFLDPALISNLPSDTALFSTAPGNPFANTYDIHMYNSNPPLTTDLFFDFSFV